MPVLSVACATGFPSEIPLTAHFVQAKQREKDTLKAAMTAEKAEQRYLKHVEREKAEASRVKVRAGASDRAALLDKIRRQT